MASIYTKEQIRQSKQYIDMFLNVIEKEYITEEISEEIRRDIYKLAKENKENEQIQKLLIAYNCIYESYEDGLEHDTDDMLVMGYKCLDMMKSCLTVSH